jgi:mevalonate kinase
MPAISSIAPGKIILCGEHAVVYGEPAIALPVDQVHSKTIIVPLPSAPAGEVRIVAPGIGLYTTLDKLNENHSLHLALMLIQKEFGISHFTACEIRVTPTIPIASGLGSRASITVSLTRAVAQFLGHPLPDEVVNQIAFETEKIHHGTPSGIDNTVITYQSPVYFRKGQPLERMAIKNGFTMLIADTGMPSSTAQMVKFVHDRWLEERKTFDSCFSRIGEICQMIYQVLRTADLKEQAHLLTENHELLKTIGVPPLNLTRWKMLPSRLAQEGKNCPAAAGVGI